MIALICQRIQDGFSYFPRKDILEINISMGKIKLNDGRDIIIVTRQEDIQGREFSDVIVHNYDGPSNLILESESRIRKQ